MQSNWTLFKSLCRVIGGQDNNALAQALAENVLSPLIEMAQYQGLLPALAMRIDEQPAIKQSLSETQRELLLQALRNNTLRNMQTVMQALKLARTLNSVGITPTFLKGTAQLLTVNEARLGFRKQSDIDLVVAPADLKAACQALIDAGYGFYREAMNAKRQPEVFHDITKAFRTSAAHHHLPPMVINGYASCVELHRHFLPRRFQRKNPLEPLLSSAHLHESRGATFQVPCAEYQIVHIVLGKLVNDSYLARRDFPIRDGCDYIELLNSVKGTIDQGLVEQHCGKNYTIFSQLATELMVQKTGENTGKANGINRRLQIMEKRYNSSKIAKLLDAHARARHLGHAMLYSPAKLPTYLQRLGKG
jgi:hypothetical protein